MKALVPAALALCYFLTARLLTNLSAPPNGAVLTVWLPSGIAVAALLIFGPRMALGAFAGALAFELSAGTPWAAALLVATSNAGGELLCCWLMVGFGGRRFSLHSVREVARFGVATCTAGLASAFLGVTSYVAFGIVPEADYWTNWTTWFGSMAIGVALIAPFLVNAVRTIPHTLARAGALELACAIAMLMVAAYFWQGPALSRHIDEPVLLLIILGLLWIAFRFSVDLMPLAVFAFAIAAVGSAVLRVGQLHPDEAFVSIFSLQMMLGGLSMVGYVLAAMVAQQRRSALALQAAQRDAVANARQAGMAEIATNVLHNVGNVLNSVNVSAGLVSARLRASRAQGLASGIALMDAHAADLAGFLTRDAKGKLLPAYLGAAAQSLAEEQRAMIEELGQLSRNIDHIKEVVATQQSYAGVSTVLEPARMCDLVEDALRINSHALARADVEVVRRFGDAPPVPMDRSRLVQILVNLVSNALHAMGAAGAPSCRLTVAIDVAGPRLRVRVVDEGEGIAPENLTRIFSHGFTTRRGGHGFGLHSCALAARDMGGTLTAHSEGLGRGATFTLEIPIGPAGQGLPAP
ncbi:MAG: MASE1 domain-containing protein [Pseudomonadota bacterium]